MQCIILIFYHVGKTKLGWSICRTNNMMMIDVRAMIFRMICIPTITPDVDYLAWSATSLIFFGMIELMKKILTLRTTLPCILDVFITITISIFIGISRHSSCNLLIFHRMMFGRRNPCNPSTPSATVPINEYSIHYFYPSDSYLDWIFLGSGLGWSWRTFLCCLLRLLVLLSFLLRWGFWFSWIKDCCWSFDPWFSFKNCNACAKLNYHLSEHCTVVHYVMY